MKKPTVTIIALTLFVIVKAQEMPKFSLNHISLAVKDINESSQFYENTLGFQQILNRKHIEGTRWHALDDHKELHLISDSIKPVTDSKTVHMAFSTSSFNSFIETLNQKNQIYCDRDGIEKKVTLKPDGYSQIYLQDPNGNWIEINSTEKWYDLIPIEKPEWLVD